MCSKLWCGYLQLDRSTASHKSSTGQSWGSLLRACRGGFSICLHLNVGKKPLPESVTVTAQSATYLEASHGLGKCCSPKFGHSLISTQPAGLWLSSPASPGQSPSGDSSSYSLTHRHAEGHCPEGKQSPGCTLITGGTKPRQGCCSTVRL